MKCPRCIDKELLMSERQGVEIDYCPECRGVWLDRGELDKIIEKTNLKQNDNYYYDDDRNDYHDSDHDHDKYHGKRKKRGFFDFDIF
jgi:Zn-finger nucleic acid-binding protein